MPTRTARPQRSGSRRTTTKRTSTTSTRSPRSATGRKSAKAESESKPMHRLRLLRFVANLRSRGVGYIDFREGLAKAEIDLDNESAYCLLLTDPDSFTEYVNIARDCLES